MKFVPKYCLTLTSESAFRSGNRGLMIANKLILDELPYLKKKKLNNKFFFRMNYLNVYKYSLKLDSFTKKKFFIYKPQIVSVLNKYHNVNENEKYWDKIIGSWLWDVINIIKLRLDDLFPFKKKKVFIIGLEKDNFNFFNNSFEFYALAADQGYLNQFIYSRIAEILKINQKKINYRLKIPEIPKKSNNCLFFFFNLFYSLYIRIFKPIVLINSYINYVDRLKINFLSKGLIIFPKENHLFKKNINTKIDHTIRSRIKIKEKEFFDKIFNSLIEYLMPTSFLEDFSKIKKNILNYSENISLIGSAMSFFSDDRYKILTAELLKQKKKPIIFEHGHVNKTMLHTKHENELKNIQQHICFSNKDGLGSSILRRLKIGYRHKYSSKIVLFTTKIDSFLSKIHFADVDREKTMNRNFNFYKNLNQDLKSQFFLKLHEHKFDFEKKLWLDKFGKDLNIYYGDSKNLIQQAKIVVISYFSTTVYEALYLDKPTIMYFNRDESWFTKKFYNFINNFFEVGIAHNNSFDAANFLNKNYYSIEDWWLSTKVRKVLNIFRKNYCVDKKNFVSSFVQNFLKN